MKRFSFVIGLLSMAVVLMMLITVSQAQTSTRHLDLVNVVGDDPIPGTGTVWHEVYPAFCSYYQQHGYEDNGDGVVSPCDVIILNDTEYHIVDVVPTYTFATTQGEQLFEAQIPYSDNLRDPTCETWLEVYPTYMNQVHIDDWSDGDGNGRLSECDNVQFQGAWWHVEKIGLDIIIGEEENPVERGTWGNIKSFFHQLIF